MKNVEVFIPHALFLFYWEMLVESSYIVPHNKKKKSSQLLLYIVRTAYSIAE